MQRQVLPPGTVVYIQDVVFPTQLVDVLTTREIAKQQEETYRAQKSAQDKRIELEASKGRADMQTDLAKSAGGIEIMKNNASAVQEMAKAIGSKKSVEPAQCRPRLRVSQLLPASKPSRTRSAGIRPQLSMCSRRSPMANIVSCRKIWL